MSRMIKRYGNRKLYDTQESRYVTLEAIASFVKQGEAKLAFGQSFQDEREGSLAGDVQIESIHQKKGVGGGEAYSPVAVEKGVIVDQRLQQSGRLLAQFVVVTRLRTENSRLQSALIKQPVLAAVFLHLVMVNGDDFSHGQIDALGGHFACAWASRLYNSRYFWLERR